MKTNFKTKIDQKLYRNSNENKIECQSDFSLVYLNEFLLFVLPGSSDN